LVLPTWPGKNDGSDLAGSAKYTTATTEFEEIRVK